MVAWGKRIAPILFVTLLVAAGMAWGAPSPMLGSVARGAADRSSGGEGARGEGVDPGVGLGGDSGGEAVPSSALVPPRPAARPVIQPISARPSTLSVPVLVARSGGGRAGADDADGEQDVAVRLQTGMVGGCARLEQVEPPTLDCSVRVGDSLVDTIKAEIENAGGSEAHWVRIEAGLPPHVSLRKLDQAGQDTDEPLVEKAEISTRLRFTPTDDQVTSPDRPIRLEVIASAEDESGNAAAKAAVHLRLHVLGGTRTIVGYKFEDANGNGARDFDEPGLPNWGISLRDAGGRTVGSTRTDGGGRFSFEIDTAGLYEVAEETRDGWVPTRPDTVQLNLADNPAGAVIDVLFGNRRVETRPVVSGFVSTDRGCHEVGTATPYTVGDKLMIHLGASGLPEADLTLRRRLPDGQSELLFDRRRLPGGQTFSLESSAGTVAGSGKLLLEAYDPAGGPAVASAECGYTVEAAAAPAIDYAPGRVDFGPVYVGQSGRQELTLRNIGQAPLNLSSLAIQGGGGSPFTIASPNAGNTAIPPGGSYTLALGYAPRASGSYQDYVLIRCNATNQPLVTIPVFGQTYDALPETTAHIQADRGCLEDQQTPLYFAGDSIQYQFQINGTGASSAQARVEDVLPGGQTKVVYNRSVPLNQPVAPGAARIVPPYGNETLRLTAQVGYTQVRDECSFKVVAGGTRIGGYKFQDDNGNGLWEGCPLVPGSQGSEQPIPGWGVTITGPESYTTVTDAAGRFEFILSAPGTYYITEETRNGWAATRPQTVSYTLQCYPGENPPPILFGNRPVQSCGCVCPCPGGTPGAATATPWAPPPPPGASPTATSNFPPPPPTFPPPGASPTATPWNPPPPPTFPPPGTPPPPPPPQSACTVTIAPRPSLANVAELAQFSAGGVVGSNVSYQWTVDGEVIRDYSELTRQGWSTTLMQVADFRNRTLSFYWKPLPSQRYPNNAGPQPRTVSVTATTPEGSCSDQVTLSVERNNTNIGRQAEDFYTNNHNQAILVEHTLWHATYPFQGFNYDGTLFFDFHRQYLDRFNNWRAEFGYPPIGLWDSGTSIPRGIDIDHAARAGSYTPLAKPSWFTLFGTIPRGNNSLPCDTQSGQRQLRDYPSNRRLLGCAVTQAWHNAVHTGVGGDMLNPQWSPRDPIFWRWHNFVDIISQERMSTFFALAGSDPDALRDLLGDGDHGEGHRSEQDGLRAAGAPGEPDSQPSGPAQQRRASPPQVVYEVPFRLYRFHDAFERYEVVFDEPVTGVQAGDLTVGGSPATAVSGEREGPYVFTGFTPPELGDFEVGLDGGAIKNLNNEVFDGGAWQYVLVDPALDEDRDGLTSSEEVHIHLTNPQDRDSDDDGLADGDEVKIHHTRALMYDSDRDSASDRCELEKGSDPSDPADTAPGCPVKSIFVCWVGNGQAVDR